MSDCIRGEKFGALTPRFKRGKTSYGKKQWLCECDCGKMTKATEGHLKSGARVSCGCRIHRRKYNLSIEDLCIGEVYGQYRKGARYRDYDFDITKEEFSNLIFKPCNYCGSEPSNTFTNKSKRKNQTFERSVYYNGVDRIDNNLGYSKENCVTCCKTCNIMKMDLDLDKFLDHVNKIAEKTKKEAEERAEAGTLKRKK